MANQIETNGYSIFSNGATLSFYTSHLNNAAGNIFTSTTYNWIQQGSTAPWYVNGEVATHTMRFQSDGTINWSGYYEGPIGGQNQSFNLSWPQLITDDLTHHLLFYIERGGGGFGEFIRINLYVDGRFKGSQQINNKPNLNAWFNIPFGIGSSASGPGTRVQVYDYSAQAYRYRSYGEYLSPEYALGLMGQLWFGYFSSKERAIGNLWRNGYVDLGINGRLGALEIINPVFYNDFGYAGPGYVARTGLASSFQVVANDIRTRTIPASLKSTTTLIANARNNSDYFARLQSSSTMLTNGGKLQRANSQLISSSQLVANNIRIKLASSAMNSKFTIYADLRRSGESAQLESAFTMNVQVNVRSGAQANLVTQSVISAGISKVTVSQANLTAQFQQTSVVNRRARTTAQLESQSLVNVQTKVNVNAQAQLVSEASLRALIADYNLLVNSSLQANINYTTNNQISSKATTSLNANVNYSITSQANLTAFATVLTVGTAKPKQIESLIIESETRRLLVHPESRYLIIDSETRIIDATKL